MARPDGVVNRAIRADEIPAAADLFFDALADLTARLNMTPPHRDRDLVAHGYAYVARTGIFRVAVDGDRLVALACAIVRDGVWFLSGFWADPARRLQGVGAPLLREVMDEGRRQGARAFYVWSSPDLAAIATYMKLRMLPGTQLFAFAGAPARDAPPALASRAQPFDIERAAALDRNAVGVRRDGDHGYWLAREGARSAIVTNGGRDVGYYYVHHGTIGPVAWTSDDVGELVLWNALRDASSDAKEVQLTAPGMNHLAIRVALASGLRLLRTSHLLWTEPIGAMDRYLPSGPLLF